MYIFVHVFNVMLYFTGVEKVLMALPSLRWSKFHFFAQMHQVPGEADTCLNVIFCHRFIVGKEEILAHSGTAEHASVRPPLRTAALETEDSQRSAERLSSSRRTLVANTRKLLETMWDNTHHSAEMCDFVHSGDKIVILILQMQTWSETQVL